MGEVGLEEVWEKRGNVFREGVIRGQIEWDGERHAAERQHKNNSF